MRKFIGILMILLLVGFVSSTSLLPEAKALTSPTCIIPAGTVVFPSAFTEDGHASPMFSSMFVVLDEDIVVYYDEDLAKNFRFESTWPPTGREEIIIAGRFDGQLSFRRSKDGSVPPMKVTPESATTAMGAPKPIVGFLIMAPESLCTCGEGGAKMEENKSTKRKGYSF